MGEWERKWVVIWLFNNRKKRELYWIVKYCDRDKRWCADVQQSSFVWIKSFQEVIQWFWKDGKECMIHRSPSCVLGEARDNVPDWIVLLITSRSEMMCLWMKFRVSRSTRYIMCFYVIEFSTMCSYNRFICIIIRYEFYLQWKH